MTDLDSEPQPLFEFDNLFDGIRYPYSEPSQLVGSIGSHCAVMFRRITLRTADQGVVLAIPGHASQAASAGLFLPLWHAAERVNGKVGLVTEVEQEEGQ